MNKLLMHSEQKIETAINIGLNTRQIIFEYSQGLINNRDYQILEFIVVEHLARRKVVMEQGMGLRHLGSRYTLRKSIQTLIDQGFVAIQESEDSRVRPLVPTERALQLFTSIGDPIDSLMVCSPQYSEILNTTEQKSA